MRKPAHFDSVSISRDGVSPGPYPPLGFLPYWDAQLGNGDYFGFYWPLGREQADPIICEMFHDEWRLEPSFSSVEKFTEWLELNDGDRGDYKVGDASFGPTRYAMAKDLLGLGRAEEAILELEAACISLPEVSEYWYALAGQLRRVGRPEESHRAALHSFRANWSFGQPTVAVLRMLQSATDGSLAHDPLVKRSRILTMKYGGEKENKNYALLRDCIDEYFDSGQPLCALQVLQNHAFMMTSETISFQERQHFVLSDWQYEFSRLCQEHLGDSRRVVA